MVKDTVCRRYGRNRLAQGTWYTMIQEFGVTLEAESDLYRALTTSLNGESTTAVLVLL